MNKFQTCYLYPHKSLARKAWLQTGASGGTINVTVLGGDNSRNDPNIKDRKVVGKFKVKHKF